MVLELRPAHDPAKTRGFVGVVISVAWMVKLDADLSAGGLVPDTRFFPHGDEFRGLRVHQIRLQGGDASSDSYCFTS